ncbi:ferritin-like domain-containing protein [Streptomyces gibsoniae]|uniref:Ferritin-like domain-containing protein n=1 Tax=Streptomyces gibsoniae TaxID=3075529 RepID=A0ABU2TVM0_9ACTN|nr:ferritin-like domain-containing protein [Streptomyces sp. DSM 41699]MDT0465018.1 ferritin-like domain-containing protein [Streptomyces sp. DSM 41699]
MPTPVDLRDLSWIRGALQTVVALEHSTMPLYCAAMYSLEVQNYPSYNIIRSVLMEEMVHMAIAANMVAALGGSPAIKGLRPTYPGSGGLPGGVAPDLRPQLAKLSGAALESFMRLEAPLFVLNARQRGSSYPTIGAFYDAIRNAIKRNAGAVERAVRLGGPANQVGGNLGYLTFDRDDPDPVASFLHALDIITEQGEGGGEGTVETAAEMFQKEGSHYARFAELRYGRRYRPLDAVPFSRETERDFFTGEEIVWPVVINTLAVPADGYEAVLALDPRGPEVRKELESFDDAYTQMMLALDTTWNGPVETWWPSLGAAVTQMDQMRVRSCFTIMRNEIPPAVVARLEELYPREFRSLERYTDLALPVFYGPRFLNNAA